MYERLEGPPRSQEVGASSIVWDPAREARSREEEEEAAEVSQRKGMLLTPYMETDEPKMCKRVAGQTADARHAGVLKQPFLQDPWEERATLSGSGQNLLVARIKTSRWWKNERNNVPQNTVCSSKVKCACGVEIRNLN